MREGKIGRVKRRLLRQAVADNLDTIRGMPPRAVQPRYRTLRIWLRRSPFLLVPLTLAASTWLTQPASPGPSPRLVRASLTGELPISAAGFTDAETLQKVDPRAFPLSVRRVVLDAGHGGTDPGASSILPLQEKDVTLDIQARLRTLLESSGFEVISTRADDRLIPLRERAKLANDSRSDILVSIHVNSIVAHTSSHGVETYYLGATSDPSLTKLAAAENSASGYSMADLRKLLDGIYSDVRRDESHRLAESVQMNLFGGLKHDDTGLENWGVKRAPFVVLVATEMPSILAEVGCMSNEKEAAMLRKPEYRQKIAEALFHGIHAYANAGEAPQKKGT